MTEEFKIMLEIFGYIGTALVIASMLMTSVVKLRFLNICGSVISLIYAAIGGAWPIVLLNGSLIAINVFQLIRVATKKTTFHSVTATASDASVRYLMNHYADDIKRYFPEYDISNTHEVHMAFIDSEAVGIIIGERNGAVMNVVMDYATPKYRDYSVSAFLFDELAEDGIESLLADAGSDEHRKYLIKMGFTDKGGHMEKTLSRKENTNEA